MKTKKILLPDQTVISRKARKARGEDRAARALPFAISQRQRSEAIGLVLLGLSASWLSYLFFWSPARKIGFLSGVGLYIGLGIYILPVILGLMGIQRFLERPFQHLGMRILGTIGTLVFGLGLLGLEGGKVGTWSFQFFSRNLGIFPTQVLFCFLTLSSLIFALDILYKDLLLSLLAVLRTLAIIVRFGYELGLVFLSMALEAVKSTGSFFGAIFSSIAASIRGEGDKPSIQTGLLLPFRGNIPEESPLAETGPGIPAPVNWRSGELADPTPENMVSAKISGDTGFSSAGEMTLSIQSLTIPGTLPTMEPPATAAPEVPSPAVTPAPPPPPAQEKTDEPGLGEDQGSTGEDDLEIEVELEEETPEKDSLDDSPLLLDDHPIDLELKKEKQASKRSYNESALPPLDLLNAPPPRDSETGNNLPERSALLLKTLEDFGIKAQIMEVVEGPAVSRFELRPAPGIKVSRIMSLADDIALALSAPSIRIEAPIPGKPALGIEIPNAKPTPVYYHDLVKNDRFRDPGTLLNLALGVTISGRPVFADLTDMPHLLIAGTTGSGKSVCVNTIIASILYQARADQVKMVMIDPKLVELSSYNGIPHLISPVVTDPKKASAALLWAVEEMERRYELLADCGVRKISTFNEELPRLRAEIDPDLETMPYIVLIIDELADLMMTSSAEVESSICRLAQMARAVGIHLVIATQRPSVDVLTGIIKANLPSRIAFAVASVVDSRTIIDGKGAERLLGKGDMLFVPKGRSKPLRLQGAFISDRELMGITDFVRSQGQPEYIEIVPTGGDESEEQTAPPDEIDEDDDDGQLMSTIEEYLSTQEKTSTSMLQRKFKIGYNRAARIMDLLEEKGLVSPLDGSNKRRVLGRRSNPQT